MTTPAQFRASCRLLRIATLVVFFGLASMLILGWIGLPGLYVPGLPKGPGSRDVLLAFVQILPSLGYLWALWAVQRAMADIARGGHFHLTVARAMRQIGAGVLAGALLNVFAVSNLSRILLDGRGSYLYFDLSGIVLGVVGAALVLLSRLVDEARLLQAELDEIL